MNVKSTRMVKPAKKGKRKYLGSYAPPSLISTPKLSHTFRFRCSTAGKYAITRAMLLNLLEVAATGTTAYRVIYALKIGSVECWAPTTSSFIAQTLSLEWNGEEYSPSLIVTDTTVNLRPAHVFSRPPKDSLIQKWISSLSSGATTVFSLTVPDQSVIDLRVTLMLYDNEAPVAGDAPSGATVGKLYYNYLDGRTSGNLAPIGGVSVLL